MIGTFRHVVATEGPLALYGGLPAAALRQAVYGGMGIGLYAPVRALIIGDTDPKAAPLWCVHCCTVIVDWCPLSHPTLPTPTQNSGSASWQAC